MRKYKVELSRRAEKDLEKVARKYQPEIVSALLDLRKNPYLGKKLSGKLKGKMSLRIGVYRILYKAYKSRLVVLVIRIGHRQGVYK